MTPYSFEHSREGEGYNRAPIQVVQSMVCVCVCVCKMGRAGGSNLTRVVVAEVEDARQDDVEE